MESTDLNWRKASYSNGGENCVETANRGGVIVVRDTKLRDGAMLTFTAETWQAFTGSIR
ncbi:MAG TPA: DUF397 domain-containing protein [Trebonia sp.]